jgi:hypothetical protein
MNKPAKAALFSALIFPGAGQLFLKKYFSAAYYAVFASVGLYLLFSNLVARTEVLIEKVQLSQAAVDLATILELFHQQTSSTTESLNPGLMIWFVAWLVSVLEAYRVAKKEMNPQPS